MTTRPTQWIKTIALAAAFALMAAACGGSAADPESSTIETGTTSSVITATTTEAPVAVEAVSLGEREAGFGPGSAALLAGKIINRLFDLEGDWAPQFNRGAEYRPRPAGCDPQGPIAAQVETLTKVNVDDAPFGEATSVEVFVYESEEAVRREVAALNSDIADACDQAIIADAMSNENQVPGVIMDLSNATGVPFDDHLAQENSASRRYRGTISIGSEQRELEQIESAVGLGTILVRVYAISTQDRAEQVSTDTWRVLLAGGPIVADDPEASTAMDNAINDLRASALPDDAFPDYFEPAQRLKVLPPVPDAVCFNAPGAEAATYGPSQLAISPGVGASEINQISRVYGTEAEAEAAFDEFITKGVDCYLETIGIPNEMFTTKSTTEEVVERNGYTVADLNAKATQTLGEQDFPVEFATTAVRVGRYVLTVHFVGLDGDSPDLVDLATQAADRIAR